MTCEMSLHVSDRKKNKDKNYWFNGPSKELVEKFLQDYEKEKLHNIEKEKKAGMEKMQEDLKFAKKWWKK